LPRDRDINRYENKGKICGHINPDVAENVIPHLPNILKNAIVFGLIWDVSVFLSSFLSDEHLCRTRDDMGIDLEKGERCL
jgi:hypothetical protein